MSSFKKAAKASDLNKHVSEGRMSGVKPWVNGLSLVSSGIRELDTILGGGHVLGSMCLMHEDTYSNHAETVLMYSLAEAISQKHKTLLIVRDSHEAKAILSALPFNMNKGSLSLDKKNPDVVMTSEEEEDDKKRHLKIAWQYGKYIKDPATSTSSSSRSSTAYCSSYDLSNRLQPSVFAENMPRVYCYAEKREVKQGEDGSFDFHFTAPEDEAKGTNADSELMAVLNGIHNAVFSFREVHSQTQSNPLRVFLPHYDAVLSSTSGSRGGAGAGSDRRSVLGAQLLLRLKHLLQHDSFPGSATPTDTDSHTTPATESPITTLPSTRARDSTSTNTSTSPGISKAHIRMTIFVTTLPAAIASSGSGGSFSSSSSSCLLQTLNSLADTVLGVESFAGYADSVPIEFRFFCGFFFVHKLQQIAAMAPHRSSACRFGLKRDRRKLHIEPLHLPPEDSRASKYQSETSLGVRQTDKGGADKDTNTDMEMAGVVGKRGGNTTVGGASFSSQTMSTTSKTLGNVNNTRGSSSGSGSGSGTSSLTRNIQKISIHGNDASRHAPSVSSNTVKALCASTVPSAAMKNKSAKDLEF